MSDAALATAADDHHELFRSALREMKTHYDTGTVHPFDLAGSRHVAALHAIIAKDPANNNVNPAALHFATAGGSSGSIPSMLSGVAAQAKQATQKSVDDQKAGATNAASQAQGQSNADQATLDFHAAMEAQRKQAIATTTATINAAYAGAEKVGAHATPAQQNAILNGMQYITNTLNTILETVTSALNWLWGKIKDIIHKIVQIAETVGHAFKSAYNEIASWF